jgi:hypothetical protein
MATISLTLPADGQTIDASDVNNPFNTIAAEINGNLDNSNIKAGAAIDRSKIAGFTDGWESLGYSPSTVTANGNRSYDLTFSSVNLTTNISNGMRLKLARSVTPPTQCTDLESGSSQYFSKTSPAGMTFTDDFTASAWVKLESYVTGTIASRYNGTSGWGLYVTSSGQIQLSGYNAGASNESKVLSYQSIPLNKWVHVAAQLDMSTFTATTTTSYVMIDGLDVPAVVSRSGSNPTALIQAGNLEIGASNGGTAPFDGKLAQVAIYSAKVTQATVRASMNQTLTGSETSLVSAYSFNNVITDLNTTNANNLTANGSAVATTVDSPFNATEYAIVMANSFSTNTTLTVQVPEGYSLPTTGGIGTCYYSTQKVPYGFPGQRGKWGLQMLSRTQYSQSSAVISTWYNIGSHKLNVPIGSWKLRYDVGTSHNRTSGAASICSTLSTANNTESDRKWTRISNANPVTDSDAAFTAEHSIELSVATDYYINILALAVASSTLYTRGDNALVQIYAECELV